MAFRDPPGVKGSGAGSGGALASEGDAVYPQLGTSDRTGVVNVAILSCTLPSNIAEQCKAIESDFLVRQAPIYKGTG